MQEKKESLDKTHIDNNIFFSNIHDNDENDINNDSNNNDNNDNVNNDNVNNDNDNDNNDRTINDTNYTNTIIQNIANDFEVTLPLKKKRGRKSKKEIEMLNKIKETNIYDDEIIYGESKPIVKYKKRGRKPKGGKIIQNTLNNNSEILIKTNVILHLKCFLSDLKNNNINNIPNSYEGISLENNSNLSYNIIKSNSNFTSNTLNNNLYNEQYNDNIINKNNAENNSNNSNNNNSNNNKASSLSENNLNPELNDENDKKNINKDTLIKLKELEYCLRTNNINNKKSACFYCTGDFDNPPIYIPKHLINGSYHVYGCFCSPECATGFLMKEQIDSSIKYERYFLLNNIYSKIYNYEKSIKPAPDPYYTLDKFFGNLTIKEYRNLIKTNRLYILIDKPITRSLPELHEDNDDFIINNKIIPTNYQEKKTSGFVF